MCNMFKFNDALLATSLMRYKQCDKYSYMFQGAAVFNHDLSQWCVTSPLDPGFSLGDVISCKYPCGVPALAEGQQRKKENSSRVSGLASFTL